MTLVKKSQNLEPKILTFSLNFLVFQVKGDLVFILPTLIKVVFGHRMKRVTTSLSMLMETLLRRCPYLLT
jgi:hypothetical protein